MFDLNVRLDGFTRIDFERKKIRKALRQAGREIQKEARRLVSRRAISNPGEYPGKITGALQRSIQVRLSKSGFLVRVAPYNKTNAMKVFYPALLYYGTKGLGGIGKLAPGEGKGKSNRRARGDRAALVSERKSNTNYIVAPRGNYMADALESRRESARKVVFNALQDSLIPRK